MSDQVEHRQSLGHLLAEMPAKDAKLHQDSEAYYCEEVEADQVRSSVRQANARFGADFATAVLYSHFALKLILEDLIDAPGAAVPVCGEDHCSRT